MVLSWLVFVFLYWNLRIKKSMSSVYEVLVDTKDTTVSVDSKCNSSLKASQGTIWSISHSPWVGQAIPSVNCVSIWLYKSSHEQPINFSVCADLAPWRNFRTRFRRFSFNLYTGSYQALRKVMRNPIFQLYAHPISKVKSLYKKCAHSFFGYIPLENVHTAFRISILRAYVGFLF